MSEGKTGRRLPTWIRKQMGHGPSYGETRRTLEAYGIQTICSDARCPNRGECWSRGTATVLILGNICTRNCPFCAVAHGRPDPPDPQEPERIAQAAWHMGIKYLVITSVDRDDLPDGGASQFARVITACRQADPSMGFEILVPDFKGVQDSALEILADARPFVFSHNVETVPSLYRTARPGGDYKRSLRLLEKAAGRWPDLPIKSSLMLGLGEKEEEVTAVLKDLHKSGCSRVAMGQYLQPDRFALPVAEFITPEAFKRWEYAAREIGFSWVMASPLTRSSYHAEQQLE